MKHTPGPWHWDSDPVKNDPMGRVRYRVCAIGKTVTQVYYSSLEGQLTNTEADARLIAACPELLSALNSILSLAQLGASTDPDHVDADFYAIAQTARAAIAKATQP